ncbi:hypothetical protein WL26_23890 [Burkholderia cepacia]|uniref:hypothetical protein n=1 Tax=Burkholderia cepacia TaxID=292 RepID=UPI0007530EDC|nr:hypothetical protein [Burkholderia cepacia]KWA05636.1 hypothetical protein WL26_23890 [Burkholderia cepacia]
MTQSDSTLFDKSTHSYPIDCITITSNGRTLRLKPDALYLFGGRGLVNIEFHGVRGAQESKLIMKDQDVPDGEWALITTSVAQGNRKVRSAQAFEDSAFFALRSKLIA